MIAKTDRLQVPPPALRKILRDLGIECGRDVMDITIDNRRADATTSRFGLRQGSRLDTHADVPLLGGESETEASVTTR